MNQLADILDDKGDQVLRIEADASVFEAIERMVEANVGSLLVTEVQVEATELRDPVPARVHQRTLSVTAATGRAVGSNSLRCRDRSSA